MANFEKAYDITMQHEGLGLWTMDPTDAGAETYSGISRRYHPDWKGWVIVDVAKDSSNFPENIKDDLTLRQLEEAFYKKRFWDPIKGDEIPGKYQIIAEEMYDTSVNMGHKRAVRYLQRTLNILNRNQKSWANIKEDCKMGPKTLRMLGLLSEADVFVAVGIMNVMQGQHSIEYMGEDEKQERFARGWFKHRVLK